MSKLFIPCEGYELSILQANFFKLSFPKIPHVEFWANTVHIPDLTFGWAAQPTRIHDLKVPGEKLTMSNLSATILVDEQLETYNEIYTWMFNISVNGLAQESVTDCLIMVPGESNKRWHFYDVFPVGMSGFTASATESTARPVTINVEFVYNNFIFESIN